MIVLCVESYFDETPLPGETVAQQEARKLGDINAGLSGYREKQTKAAAAIVTPPNVNAAPRTSSVSS